MDNISNIPDFNYEELLSLSFGELEGEDDTKKLNTSLILTNSIIKLLGEKFNYVLSPKGAGKSAIFNAYKNKLFPKEVINYKNLNVVCINDSFVFEDEYLNPKRFKHNLENKNYTFAWGLYLISKLIGNINSNFKDSDYYSDFISKIKQIDSFKEDFDLYNIFDYIEDLNLQLDFVVNGQQMRLSPKIHSKKQRKKLNLNLVVNLINEFYKNNEITTLILIDRVDNFVGQEEYKIQKKYIQGLVSSIEEIRRAENIQPILFLRTDLYHSLKIRFEYDKAKSRTLHLIWSNTEILRFLTSRLFNNNYIRDNYDSLLRHLYLKENGYKKSPLKFLNKLNPFKRKQSRVNIERNSNYIIFEHFIKIFFPNEILCDDKDNGSKKMEFTEWIFTHFIDNNQYINPRSLIYYFNRLNSNQYNAYHENAELRNSAYYCKVSNGDYVNLNVFLPEVMIKTFKEIQNEELIGILSLLTSKKEQNVFKKINDISYKKGTFKYGDIKFKKYGMEKEEYDRIIKFLDIIGFCKLIDHQLYSVPILYQRKIDLEFNSHNMRS